MKIRELFSRPSMDMWGGNKIGEIPLGQVKIDMKSATFPMEEQTINNIASHFSSLHVNAYNTKTYKELNTPTSALFKIRPNGKQTPLEFWHTFFYNLFRYGNAIIVPVYSNKVITELILIDMSVTSCYFIDSGNDDALFMTFYNNEIGDMQIVAYEDIIHLRLKPQQVQNNEQPYEFTNDIPSIIDQNLSNILTDLYNSLDIRAIFTKGVASGQLSSATQLSDEEKRKEADNIVKRIKNKIVVLDSTEKLEFTNFSIKSQTMEEISQLRDLYFQTFGIAPEIADNTYTFEQYSVFYKSILYPKILDLSQEVTYKLLTRSQIKNGWVINFNIPLVSGIPFKDMVNLIDKGIYQGFASPNEIRVMLGLQPVVGGDDRTGNLNMKTLQGEKPPNNKGQDPKGGEK